MKFERLSLPPSSGTHAVGVHRAACGWMAKCDCRCGGAALSWYCEARKFLQFADLSSCGVDTARQSVPISHGPWLSYTVFCGV
jgi:hypothetical protein